MMCYIYHFINLRQNYMWSVYKSVNILELTQKQLKGVTKQFDKYFNKNSSIDYINSEHYTRSKKYFNTIINEIMFDEFINHYNEFINKKKYFEMKYLKNVGELQKWDYPYQNNNIIDDKIIHFVYSLNASVHKKICKSDLKSYPYRHETLNYSADTKQIRKIQKLFFYNASNIFILLDDTQYDINYCYVVYEFINWLGDMSIKNSTNNIYPVLMFYSMYFLIEHNLEFLYRNQNGDKTGC